MRQFLTVAFLGATLAFGATAALASDNVDYVPSYQRTQSESVVSRSVIRTASRELVVAGGGSVTTTAVYRRQREENFGR
jgi:hypothetical protein